MAADASPASFLFSRSGHGPLTWRSHLGGYQFFCPVVSMGNLAVNFLGMLFIWIGKIGIQSGEEWSLMGRIVQIWEELARKMKNSSLQRVYTGKTGDYFYFWGPGAAMGAAGFRFISGFAGPAPTSACAPRVARVKIFYYVNQRCNKDAEISSVFQDGRSGFGRSWYSRANGLQLHGPRSYSRRTNSAAGGPIEAVTTRR